jgi:hypothetical protein
MGQGLRAGGAWQGGIDAFFDHLAPDRQRMTPNIDERRRSPAGIGPSRNISAKSRSAGIIGMSIIVAAAVLGGLLAALHG